MSLRIFISGLIASFGVAWLAVVVVPYFQMRNLPPITFIGDDGNQAVFIPKRAGRIADGAKVYAENGCYVCHTQVVRPTYAGNDLYRPDWGGLQADPDRGDTRRETNAYDFLGESFAQIGLNRMGPDLSNIGLRVRQRQADEGIDPEQWLLVHLFDPTEIPALYDSRCPPHRFLFKRRKIQGSPSTDALPVKTRDGYEIVPGPDARALVSYLMSLRKDQPVPPALDFAPKKRDGGS